MVLADELSSTQLGKAATGCEHTRRPLQLSALCVRLRDNKHVLCLAQSPTK